MWILTVKKHCTYDGLAMNIGELQDALDLIKVMQDATTTALDFVLKPEADDE